MNLVEGLHKQIARARELQKLYDEIPGGIFGSSMINLRIKQAEHSIENGDAVEMLAAYGALEALE